MTAATTQRWVCPTCRHANPVEEDLCAGCGVSFAAQLRGSAAVQVPPQPAAVHLDGTNRSTTATNAVAGVRELAIVAGLFLLWKFASAISITDASGAFARGRWIWRLERTLRLPSELSVQNGLLAHHDLVQLVNVFYLVAHLGSLVIFLPWMFLRHRAQYRRWRNVIAVFTGISLLIQLVSVAPPRLLPQFGFVDTAALYHESAYQHLGRGLIGQLSSMPSIHVGWAIAIAMAVISVSTSRRRWLILAHPLLTVYAVVATANHFWLDCVAAAALVAAVFIVGDWLSRRASAGSRRRHRRHEPATAAEPPGVH
jgi:PAP2 superfamily